MRRAKRDSEFTRIGDRLIRSVTLGDGRSYRHRCTKSVYEAVAHEIADHDADGITGKAIAEALDAPYTQVYVAIAFLVERGCVTVRYRRNCPASAICFEDAMVEFHALGP